MNRTIKSLKAMFVVAIISVITFTGSVFAVSDTVEPTINISAPSASSVAQGGTVSYNIYFDDDTAVTSVYVAKSHISLNGFTANVSVTGSGMEKRVVTLSNIQGTAGKKNITVSAGRAYDAAGNMTPAVTSLKFDLTAPVAPKDTVEPTINIANPSVSSVAQGGTVSYTVYFDDDTAMSAINLSSANISKNGFTANVTVSGTGLSQRVVTLSNIQGTAGQKNITILAGAGKDEAGNITPAVTSLKFNLTAPVAPKDTVEPTINISAPTPSSLVIGGKVSYTVYFDDDVAISSINLSSANIKMNGFTATVTVSGTGLSQRVITFSNIQGTVGQKNITILAGAGKDAAGNITPAVTSLKFNLTEPKDTIAPIATVTGIYSGMKVTEGETVVATVTYIDNKAVVGSNLTASGITLHGFTATSKTVTHMGNHVYRVVFTGVEKTANASYITVAANTAWDAESNKNKAAESREFTIVQKAVVTDKLPTISIKGPNPAKVYTGATVKYTVTFADDKGISRVNLTKDYISLHGFTANISISGSGNTRTVTLSNIKGTAGTAKYISVAAGAAVDAIGQRTKSAISSKFTILEKTVAKPTPVVTKYSGNCIDDLKLLGDINKEITYFASWLRAEKYTASYVQENNYVAENERMTYMVEYYNGSTAPAPNVVFELTIPYKVEVEEINGGGKITSQTDKETVITWNMGNIPTGAYCRLFVRVRFNENVDLEKSANISEIFYPTLKTTAGGNYSYSYMRQLFVDLTEGKTGTYKSYLLSFDTSNQIRPDDEITRAEFAKLLADAGLLDVKIGSNDYKTFKDADKIPAYARDAVSALVGKDIIQAFPDGEFKPDYPILMEDAYQMLAQTARYVSETKLSVYKPVFLYTEALKGKHNEVSAKKDYIMELMRQNVIVKYESNPDSYALRKDIVRIVNALTFRGPFVETMPEKTLKFSDIREDSLTFYDIIGASNSYKYIYDYRLWQEITEIL